MLLELLLAFGPSMPPQPVAAGLPSAPGLEWFLCEAGQGHAPGIRTDDPPKQRGSGVGDGRGKQRHGKHGGKHRPGSKKGSKKRGPIKKLAPTLSH